MSEHDLHCYSNVKIYTDSRMSSVPSLQWSLNVKCFSATCYLMHCKVRLLFINDNSLHRDYVLCYNCLLLFSIRPCPPAPSTSIRLWRAWRRWRMRGCWYPGVFPSSRRFLWPSLHASCRDGWERLPLMALIWCHCCQWLSHFSN